MKIAILQFELLIDGAFSLKDKRRVVRSLKDRLHREHLVSVAEVGSQDVWNLATMGLAAVSGDAAYLASMMDRIEEKLASFPDARLGSISREILDVDSIAVDETAEDGSPLWTEAELRDAEEPEPGVKDGGETA